MSERIVVYAEDVRQARESTTELLGGRFGYKVHAHENGRQALEDIRELVKDPNNTVLLLTDNQMPEMTGLELVAALSEQGIRVPTIVLSADDDIEKRLAADGLKDKVDHVLPKPLHFVRLKEALTASFEKHESPGHATGSPVR